MQTPLHEMLEEELGEDTAGIEHFAPPSDVVLPDKAAGSYEGEGLEEVREVAGE